MTLVLGGSPTLTVLAWHQPDSTLDAGPQHRDRWPHPGWGTPEPTTRQVAAHLTGWLSRHTPDIRVSVDLRAPFALPPAEAAQLLVHRAAIEYTCMTEGFHSKLKRYVFAALTCPGRAQVNLSSQASLPEMIAILRDYMITAPTETLQGALIIPGIPPSSLQARDYLNHPELRDTYILAPSPLLVLTERHLDRARDLSSWTITPLPHHRYLVEAPNPADWYQTPILLEGSLLTPDHEAQARHDLGGLILPDHGYTPTSHR